MSRGDPWGTSQLNQTSSILNGRYTNCVGLMLMSMLSSLIIKDHHLLTASLYRTPTTLDHRTHLVIHTIQPHSLETWLIRM